MTPPIAERRKELKKALWMVSEDIKSKNDEIKSQEIFLEKTADLTGASTADARKLAIKHLLLLDPELKALKIDLSHLEGKKNDLDEELSDINFRQRERTNAAATELAKQVEKLAGMLERFTEATYTFTQGAERVERAVNDLTGKSQKAAA